MGKTRVIEKYSNRNSEHFKRKIIKIVFIQVALPKLCHSALGYSYEILNSIRLLISE
jgi:hypothetical protein